MLPPAPPPPPPLVVVFASSGDKLGNGGKSHDVFFVGGSIAASDRTNCFDRRANETLFAPTSATSIMFASSFSSSIVLLL
jgi:hypothetical protein